MADEEKILPFLFVPENSASAIFLIRMAVMAEIVAANFENID